MATSVLLYRISELYYAVNEDCSNWELASNWRLIGVYPNRAKCNLAMSKLNKGRPLELIEASDLVGDQLKFFKGSRLK